MTRADRMLRAEAKTPWTEAHRREAREALVLETFRMMRGKTGDLDYEVQCSAKLSVDTEDDFRAFMGGLGLDDASIDHEVQRVQAMVDATPEVRGMIDAARADCERIVDKLATGRLVRETAERWEVVFAEGGREGRPDDDDRGETYAKMRAAAFAGARAVRVRVTRIRRAP